MQSENFNDIICKKIEGQGLPKEICKLFIHYYNKLREQGDESGFIREQDIEPIDHIQDIQALGPEYSRLGESSLDKLVFIKLNGGLGTSMGMPYPKSFLPVKEGYTFLDISILQTRYHNIPLVLMNSFSTHEIVDNYLRKKWEKELSRIFCFLQHKYPKIVAEDLSPATYPEDPKMEWNPPGHGDIYGALYLSGTLGKMLDQGKKYAFISNIDNLGATFDRGIYGYFIKQGFHLLMEVAPRLKRDKKGGHLALFNNKIILREIAQCHPLDMKYFMDVSKHKYFNTNNIWIDLEYLYSYIKKNGIPKLPLIINPKRLNPRDDLSKMVYQLETAMGSAISVFDHTGIIRVNRNRYIPVKTTPDLLLIMSDCYKLGHGFKIISTLGDGNPMPYITLDERFYKKIDDFMERFPEIPSLKECFLFSVKGDIVFEQGVKCVGEVYVESRDSKQKIISNILLTGKKIL